MQDTPELTASEITPAALKSKLDNGDDILLLDVRSEIERDIANLGGLFIPLGEISQRLDELEDILEDANEETLMVVYCHHGIRSMSVCHFLRQSGFPQIKNLTGGIDRWALEIDPDMARY